jgi:hypothetical protein
VKNKRERNARNWGRGVVRGGEQKNIPATKYGA